MKAVARRVDAPRRALPVLAVSVALWLALALGAGMSARAAEAAVDAPDEAVALAPGTYLVPGHEAVWGPAFHGQVANTGFVVGSRCIAVIDSGGSPTVGRALLATVRRHSALPVCFVVNTHPHPDHVMGNVAFSAANGSDAGPVFVGHQRLRASLAARAPFYLNVLQRDFEPADQTTTVPQPTLAVTDRLEIDLGGRVLELRAWPTAHTDSDLTVLDRASGTLWLGDLAFVGHLPVLDGRLSGWLSVLKSLPLEPAVHVVPGHGPVLPQGADAYAPTVAYLKRLEADVSAAIDQGLSLSETVERLGSPPAGALAGWRLTEDFHRRNITAAFAELEWAK
jgi:quinoprotein relay system zinc metallohydrolase 2